MKICSASGLLPSSACPKDQIISEVFIKGTEPKTTCTVHAAAEEVVLEKVCTVSGMLANENCPEESVAVYRLTKVGDSYYEANEDGSPNYSKPISSKRCNIH